MAPPRLAHPITGQITPDTSPQPSPEIQQAEGDMWKCCNCSRVHDFNLRSGRHPVGSIFCRCTSEITHKPCEGCQFAGPLKYFVPIQEPFTIVTPDSHKGEEIPYGIICRKCGTSWRATPMRIGKTGMKGTRTKWCPRKYNSPPTLSSRTRKGRSIFFDFGQAPKKSKAGNNISHVALMTSIDGDASGNAFTTDTAVRSTEIQFSGLMCTCGSVSRADTSFCFRIVEGDKSGLERERNRPSLLYHDGPVIDIKGIKHPNPLRCNPVTGVTSVD